MKKEKKRSAERYLVPAVEQASRVLLSLADARSPHMSLTEVCAQVGIHKSKAFSILHTLQKFGFVQRNTNGKGYSLGPGLVTLSRRVLDNLNAPRLAEPLLEKLANKAGGTAILGLIADKGVFVVAKQEGHRDIGYTIRIGTRFPLTYGSHGKAIAAFFPPAELDKLLQQKKLYFYGESGIFNRKRLEEELAQVRRDGFALDIGEMRPGLSAAAAPVFGAGARPIGYIVVIGLVSEEAARQLGPTIGQAAEALSRQLGADPDKIWVGGASDEQRNKTQNKREEIYIPTLTKGGKNMALQTKKSAAKKSTETRSSSLTINGEAYELEIGKVFAKHGSIVLK